MNVFLTGQPKAGNHISWGIPKILGKELFNIWYGEEFNKKPNDWFLNKTDLFFIKNHLSYSIDIEKRLRYLGSKMILIIRDLRDLIASVYRATAVRLHPKSLLDISRFESLTQEQFINWCILAKHWPHAPEYFKKYFLPWMNVDFCYTTRFEILIGSKGGGNDQLQKEEFQRICEFIDLPQTDEWYEENTPKLYNLEADTFIPGGKIGVWKKYFNQKNIETFEIAAGELNRKLGYEK